MKLDSVTMIVPCYQQPLMLERQLATWACYDTDVLKRFTFCIIDDHSPYPLEPIVRDAHENVLPQIRLYRMARDVKWGRNIARNAGVHSAETDWVINIDVDHVMPALCAKVLFLVDVDPAKWYRFQRIRIGAADETRQKDALPEDCTYGVIKPHIDSHMMTRELFMSSPYDPDYQGFLGGGTPFLERMKKKAVVELMPSSVHLWVYTRHVIPDASVTTLDRDTSKYKALKREKEAAGRVVPHNPFDYEWECIL